MIFVETNVKPINIYVAKKQQLKQKMQEIYTEINRFVKKFRKFPPRTLIGPRTIIRQTRVISV